MKLIDKDALVVEIERRIKALHSTLNERETAVKFELKDFLSFLDTLEVKEADVEKELDKEWNKCEPIDEGMGLEIASIEHEQFDNIAKHFFELGLKTKGE